MANFYAKYPSSNASSALVTTVQGEGTAGAPVGGLLTVQGDPAGTPIPVSGSFTDPATGPTGSPVPADATYVGMSVAGTLTGIVGTASGLKVDGSAVVQPVSGTVAATQSGTWTVQPGDTANTTPWLTTISQAGNSATVSAGGALKVDASASTQPVSGTVTANQGGTWNITNVSGTVSLPTGAATETTLAKLPVAQASTTSGQSGPLVQGAVTTAAPSYTTAQTSPLSLTTGGALRVDASGSTQPVSGTVAATQSGTWTVQPGNTANTTPWLVVQSKTKANAPITNDYSSVNVTTAAYVQLVASTTSALTRLYIQDTSGSFMIIATGAAASEVDQFYYGPGFASFVDLAIPASTRISIKALDTTANTGRLIMDFFT